MQKSKSKLGPYPVILRCLRLISPRTSVQTEFLNCISGTAPTFAWASTQFREPPGTHGRCRTRSISTTCRRMLGGIHSKHHQDSLGFSVLGSVFCFREVLSKTGITGRLSVPHLIRFTLTKIPKIDQLLNQINR